MIELYKIHQRIGRSAPTGAVEKLRNGNTRRVHVFREFYKTDMGDIPREDWYEKVSEVIKEDKETETLELIKQHCRDNCAWLHSEKDITEYSMEILAGRDFLCGNENWKDVGDAVKGKYIMFEFNGGAYE